MATSRASRRIRRRAAMTRLPRSFFGRSALVVARELLGKVLVHEVDGEERSGTIVETEAYLGERDLASHASRGRTARTEVMFGPPGRAYVYLIYGMHHCLNVVTGEDGAASAVLLRAIAPVGGIVAGVRTDGPGRLAKALGVTRAHNEADLCAGSLFLRNGQPAPARGIARGPRIGVDYAGVWAGKPYRFWLRGHPCVSRPRA
jgi:DNA-3-methyladenine glycosylase